MSSLKPYRAATFRGMIVVAKGDRPISVNNAPMSWDGNHYVDDNLDVWESYSDRYGCSNVTGYHNWEDAWDAANEFNNDYEVKERRRIKKRAEQAERQRIEEEKHWKIVEELKAERKRKRQEFFSKIKRTFGLETSH